jgi:flavin reductase (DIM6/NTAB) family NADH-FMN oxidoreductase RutF
VSEPSTPSTTSEQFRDALRHFPAGVTIVTIKVGDRIHGLTVSAFAPISPEPALIMVAIDHRHSAHALLESEGAVFAVNFLSEEQSELSNRFAWQKDEDRFKNGDWGTATTGAPVLRDALAWLDCTIHASHPAGTHTIYVGEVKEIKVPKPEEHPLVFWNRGYRKLGALRSEEERAD